MSNTPQRAIMKFKDDVFVNKVFGALHSSGKLKINGLGIFEIRHINEREGVSISTGKRITIPAHKKVVFRPTKKFRDLVQTYGN